MATSPIRTIFWDCGGVLLTNGWDHRERAAVLTHFSLDWDTFEQRHPEANDAWEKGEITVEQYLDRTVFYTTRSFTEQQFIAAMKAQSIVLHTENMRILGEVAASKKYTMALLNNEARELNDYRIRTFGLRRYFSSFFSSCYVGLRKPGAAIFQRALDILQCDAGEAIFIDDRKENTDAATSVGMQAIQMQTPVQLRDDLSRLGISTGLA